MENKSYELNEKERLAWYDAVIRPLFLDGKTKSDKPIFVLLTGQPGAGKTTASAKYAQMLTPEPVKFGGDDLRILLPYAQELLKEKPLEYPFITKKDMSWARQKLVTEALENGYNIQIDSILSNPNDWRMGTLLEAKAAGYRVECVALGVHRYLSEVSMFGRREEQIKSLGVGFPVTMEPHDIAYDILPEVISRMYTEGVADKVAIYNRVFENYYDTDQAQNPNGHDIMRGLIKARQDYLGIDSLRYIQTSWENIYENMLDRNASTEQLNEVLSYYNAFRKNSGIYLVDQNNGAQNMMFYMRMHQRGGK